MPFLSQFSETALSALTTEQKTKILYGYEPDRGETADVAILLGCHLELTPLRVAAAAELYRTGRVKAVVCSGGVAWQNGGAPVSEADYMRAGLLARGVPAEAIVTENESRNTRENMIFSVACIERTIGWHNVRRVLIVTSAFHMRRSLAWARAFLPRFAEVGGVSAREEHLDETHWFQNEEGRSYVEKNLLYLHRMVVRGETADIAFE